MTPIDTEPIIRQMIWACRTIWIVPSHDGVLPEPPYGGVRADVIVMVFAVPCRDARVEQPIRHSEEKLHIVIEPVVVPQRHMLC